VQRMVPISGGRRSGRVAESTRRSRRRFLASAALWALAPRAATLSASRGVRPLTIPVWIDGRGPFEFIVDTAATHTAIASHVPPQLSRTAERAGANLRIEALSGSIDVPTIVVEAFRAGEREFGPRSLALLPRHALRSADGLLGQDAFGDAALALDFAANRAALRAAGAGSADPRRIRVPMLRDHSSRACLTVTHAAGRVRALVDTGALRSVAWSGLHGVRVAPRRAPHEDHVPLTGADGSPLSATEAELPTLRVGSIRWPAGPGLLVESGEGRPEPLLLGLDRLSQLDRLTLDYAASTIELNPRRAGRAGRAA
jgi:predicted aspartyl protease